MCSWRTAPSGVAPGNSHGRADEYEVTSVDGHVVGLSEPYLCEPEMVCSREWLKLRKEWDSRVWRSLTGQRPREQNDLEQKGKFTSGKQDFDVIFESTSLGVFLWHRTEVSLVRGSSTNDVSSSSTVPSEILFSRMISINYHSPTVC